VHPGYGFLSENMRFVAELEKLGITFIGPNSHAMDAMGDKIHSKNIAKKAGVTVVPGYVGEVTSVDHGLTICTYLIIVCLIPQLMKSAILSSSSPLLEEVVRE
jgi:acetyl/propionyl-CoA carboxylase alpha subunit